METNDAGARDRVMTVRIKLRRDDEYVQQYVKELASRGESKIVSTVASMWAARALGSLEIIL